MFPPSWVANSALRVRPQQALVHRSEVGITRGKEVTPRPNDCPRARPTDPFSPAVPASERTPTIWVKPEQQRSKAARDAERTDRQTFRRAFPIKAIRMSVGMIETRPIADGTSRQIFNHVRFT